MAQSPWGGGWIDYDYHALKMLRNNTERASNV